MATQPSTIRALDIVFSILAIVVFSPVMLVIATVGLASGGSPFFFQTRVGRNQVPFTLVKFRTMAPQTESVATHLVDASSITRFGGLLRKTKLDELPQLFNVFAGHMSLVGPRPCLPNQLELIEERKARHVFDVRPGLTGLAQIRKVDMSTPRKLARYDKIMATSLCPSIYLKLLFRTAIGGGQGDRVRRAHA